MKEEIKNRAKELVHKFLPLVDCGDNIYTTKIQKANAKQCDLIAKEYSNQQMKEFAIFISDYSFYEHDSLWITDHNNYSGCAYTIEQLIEEFQKQK